MVNAAAAAASASAQKNTNVQASKTGLVSNMDTFLTLLTTQLRSQDPTQPVDTKDFTNQLTQFAGVEQSLLMNEKMEQLIDVQRSTHQISMAAYIGKEVTYSIDQIDYDGKSKDITYNLPDDVKSVSVKILDQKGNLIKDIEGPVAKGQQFVKWDGRNVHGNKALFGDYKVTIDVVNNDGLKGKIQGFNKGIVSSIDNNGGDVSLTIGNHVISLNKVIKIQEAPDQSASSTTSVAHQENKEQKQNTVGSGEDKAKAKPEVEVTLSEDEKKEMNIKAAEEQVQF